MRKRNLPTIFFFAVVVMLSVRVGARAQSGSGVRQMKKEEVFFSVERRLSGMNESLGPGGVATELDALIEITDLTMRPDGKAEVTIKERPPSDATYAAKSIRLVFAPPAPNDKEEKWTWETFEDNRKFYPVDKLFPYARNELGARKQATVASWNEFIAAVNKQAEAASKALETAKAVLKADPAPLPAVISIRGALADAMKENRTEDILNAYRELNQQTEAVATLGDTQTDLKANDAYLRLNDEFRKSAEATKAARQNYLQKVAAYNQAILRLPFSLVAFGLEFRKIDPNITEDQ